MSGILKDAFWRERDRMRSLEEDNEKLRAEVASLKDRLEESEKEQNATSTRSNGDNDMSERYDHRGEYEGDPDEPGNWPEAEKANIDRLKADLEAARHSAAAMDAENTRLAERLAESEKERNAALESIDDTCGRLHEAVKHIHLLQDQMKEIQRPEPMPPPESLRDTAERIVAEIEAHVLLCHGRDALVTATEQVLKRSVVARDSQNPTLRDKRRLTHMSRNEFIASCGRRAIDAEYAAEESEREGSAYAPLWRALAAHLWEASQRYAEATDVKPSPARVPLSAADRDRLVRIASLQATSPAHVPLSADERERLGQIGRHAGWGSAMPWEVLPAEVREDYCAMAAAVAGAVQPPKPAAIVLRNRDAISFDAFAFADAEAGRRFFHGIITIDGQTIKMMQERGQQLVYIDEWNWNPDEEKNP